MATRPTQLIQTHAQLQQLAAVLGVRTDWHEPDEQGVDAYVVGFYLDNAMGSGLDHSNGERQVVITQHDEPVAVVNLATLMAWAAAPIDARYVPGGRFDSQVVLTASNGLELERRPTRYGTQALVRAAAARANRERKASSRG